jgi:hypothetical protein
MTSIVKLMETKPQSILSEEDNVIWNEMVSYLEDKPQIKSAAQIIELIDEAYVAITGINVEQNDNSNKWHNVIAKELIQKYYLVSF